MHHTSPRSSTAQTLLLATTALVCAACGDRELPTAAAHIASANVVPGPVIAYTAHELGMLPGDAYSEATAVNDQGTIVGWSRKTGAGARAVVFNSQTGGVLSLGVLPGTTESRAFAVNHAERVVGSSGRFAFHSTYTSGAIGSMKKIPMPVGSTSTDTMVALGINRAGTVVGWVSRPPFHLRRAFRWTPGTSAVVDIHPSYALSSEAVAINDAGEIAGTLGFTSPTPSQAVRWDVNGATNTVHQPGFADASSSRSIGASGLVGGAAGSSAFLRDKAVTTWTILSGYEAITGVSAKDRVIERTGATGTRSAGSWSFKNLTSPLPYSDPTLKAINLCGDIVGGTRHLFSPNETHAVLWKHAFCD